ncbi:LacI family DNA-binding transcriptional regulator [Microbacterium oleivorans]|uniref:LacI family DNA-binding transcriptional regulator n=1 Tax=Microbacterium oleivorans TaxID=273677 RepID=UPI002041B660|nr:substrate-binding domain-containing protein [Microbacterium oleivorans]MCM3696738.1 substrate-binding domain-containing protein [Microbacterium oleivorans]
MSPQRSTRPAPDEGVVTPAAEPAVRRGGTPHGGPTQADVARHAGVSAQTVSRVVTGAARVDEPTRERVLASMRELGYRPNRAARALRSARYRSIGVVMSDLTSYGSVRTWEAISRAGAASGYAVALVPTARFDRAAVTEAIERARDQAVDGLVIAIGDHLSAGEDLPLPDDIPVVVVDASALEDRSFVDTDQTMGAGQAVGHLLALGHRTVHHVAGPVNSYSAVRREDGWRTALAAAGRDVPGVERGDWSALSGYAAGCRLRDRPDVTAVFAANDQMALGVLRALHETGVAVPARVSVVGFDDMPEAAQFWPPLTSVHQEFDEVGRAAVDVLLTRIDDAAALRRLLVPTRLVVRGSTAPVLRKATP